MARDYCNYVEKEESIDLIVKKTTFAFENPWNYWDMSKFGELIDDKLPLLLVFYNAEDEISDSMNPVLKDVAAAMGDKGKVIKIDTEKNIKLSDALRVKVLPTLMIYKLGEMVWRQSGEQDANTLISLMQDHL